MLVASAVAVAVFGATLALLESSTQLQSRDTEWALILQRDRVGLARMTQELRQASKVEEAKANAIVFMATIGGKSWKIKYECSVAESGSSYHECVRVAAEEGKALPTSGPATATAIVNGGEVFSYSPSSSAPTLVTVKLELPSQGTLRQSEGAFKHTVVLENAAFIRNLNLAG